ncbi:MAG TPA: TraB/GumN family protein [Chthoniobacterales bacterium]|nr:TraB/GumN family protein [Chthoniobacterales bacterium]
MKRWVILLSALWTLPSGLPTTGAAPQGKHFLWRVTNAPAPFYLVGSMHELRKSDWTIATEFNPEIDQTQKFIFERDPGNNDPTDLWRKLNAHTTYPRGVTIQQRVSPSTFALLKRIARIPPGAYETQKPWAIAAFNLKATGMDTVKSRWSVDHYIYEKIRHRAEIGGLETIDEFVSSFAEMNDRESESFFLQAVEYGQRSPELLDETIAAWKAGSPARIYQLYAPRRNGADGYWRWIEKRTARWIPRIEDAIKSGKPTMVIVGALHVSGPRGVIAELQKRGYKLEQL